MNEIRRSSLEVKTTNGVLFHRILKTCFYPRWPKGIIEV